MKAYQVSNCAHGRGFGPPEEIVLIGRQPPTGNLAVET